MRQPAVLYKRPVSGPSRMSAHAEREQALIIHVQPDAVETEGLLDNQEVTLETEPLLYPPRILGVFHGN